MPTAVQDLPVPSKADAVAAGLRQDIFDRRYRAGDRLPSERDLAAAYGTTRGAVREALRSLEQLGLAAVQPGGARVCALETASPDVIGLLLEHAAGSDQSLLDQLLSVHTALMGLAIHQALDKATDAELGQLLEQIRSLRDCTDPVQRLQRRMDLGNNIMHCSGNLVLRLLANSLRLQLPTSTKEKLHNLVPEPPQELASELAAAMANRDSDAAVAVMRRMLEHSRAALRKQTNTTTTTTEAAL